jgi:hypothetical protein
MAKGNTETWKSNGKDGRELREEILKNGYLTNGTTPADVWKNNTTYQKYPLARFRTNFNCMKKSLQKELNMGKQQDHKGRNAMEQLEDAFSGKFFYSISIY